MGRTVFKAWSRYELGVATVTAATALLSAKDEGNGKRTAALITPMWTLSVVQSLVLQPKMRALAEGLDFVNRDLNEPRYAAHRKIHGAYMAADGIKFLLGLAASVMSNG